MEQIILIEARICIFCHAERKRPSLAAGRQEAGKVYAVFLQAGCDLRPAFRFRDRIAVLLAPEVKVRLRVDHPHAVFMRTALEILRRKERVRA